MFLAKTPAFFQFLMPAYTWRVPGKEKILYLTFDDGPIPVLTPWVLELLESFQASATFFCVGDNIRKHPDIFQKLLEGGHAVGNHTFNHLNGWRTNNATYLENVAKCSQIYPSKLFRPPYGLLKPSQSTALKKTYQIIMWDVLSWDFSANVSPKSCLHNVLNNARAGSIVVLHDNLKAEQNLRYALPKILEHFSALGFRFEALHCPKQ